MPVRFQDSTVSEDAIASLVADAYPFGAPLGCRFWRKGMADTYRLTTDDKQYFLKVHRADRRSKRDVEEEVRLLRHLLADDVGVCEPVASADGRWVLGIRAPEGERFAVLYRAAEGVEGTTDLHRRSLGKMVACMHQSADRLDPPYERDFLELGHLLDDNLKVIGCLMERRAEDFNLVARIAARTKSLVESSLSLRAPEHGVCHGDLHGGDVAYSSDGRPVIYDFESSGTGWRALDIGVFGGSPDWMDISPDGELKRQREVGEFLDGYTSVRNLTKGEAAVLGLDYAAHHIFLMGAVLRYWTTRDGWHWANDDFINWHMKWFRNWSKNHEV